jgi:hypothetical protein
MIARFREARLATPTFRQDGGQFVQTLPRPTAQVTPQVTAQVVTVLGAAQKEARSREELQSAAGMADREHFRQTYVEPLVTAGWLERTIPDKPTSRFQKYRLTDKGRAWLAAQTETNAKEGDKK